MPKSPADRKNLERQRKREAGLIKIELWIKPEWSEKIKKLLEQLKDST